eukprot:TRINITY_DN2146_c0_g1_i1.p1 TRINITY_DN2146_c0_g1~~TRINITY_DN2146_c0_g1_i1.p1  ORF type:complete len:138 (+),score=27.06 TRINITY_DN2146_c0_g1_i1:112-525(+)
MNKIARLILVICLIACMMIHHVVVAEQRSQTHSYSSNSYSRSASSNGAKTVSQSASNSDTIVNGKRVASASRSINGISFDYTFDDGKETLKASGIDPSIVYDEADVIRAFRQSLNIDQSLPIQTKSKKELPAGEGEL